MRTVILVFAAAMTVQVQADTLADMNAAVRRLAGRQPVRATLTIEQKVKSAGKYANDSTARAATAEVAHDAAGVSIIIPQSLVERASQQAHDADATNTSKDAIGAIRSLDVIEALNFRDSLLLLTAGAKVLAEKRVVFRGRPARVLTLKLSPRPEKRAGTVTIGSVNTDERMTMWVGDDNLPIAAERSQKTTAGILFLKGTFTSQMSYTFAHEADRLVLARLEVADGGTGMGQKFEKKSVQTLAVR